MADPTNKEQNQKKTITVTRHETVTNYARSTSAIKRGLQSLYLGPQTSVRESTVEIELAPINSSPPGAAAAPTGTNGFQFSGLVEALNTYQNDLVKRKIVAKADVYEIVFDPPALGAKKVINPGSTDRSKTAGKNATSAKQALDPKTDSVKKNSQNFNIQAGTQIIQVIDQVMRNSDLIREQALWQVDSVTQKLTPSPGTGTGQTVWYNITVESTQLDYDVLRRDFAYHMKFIVTPYAITQMASEYFPDSDYRGSHKSYNYWFTGQNTQILSYEQTFNNLYNLVLSGEASTKTAQIRDHRDQYTRVPMPTTEQKTGQQTGYLVNSAADSGADYLYSPNELAKIRMKIIGDPAFLQQDIVETGVNGKSFNFNSFNRDGGINFNSGEVIFDISWNQPVDYNFETGVMNTANSSTGRAKQFNVYQLIEVKSHFSRGRFEQDIEGRQFVEWNGSSEAKAATKSTRPGTKKSPPQGFVGPPSDLSGKRKIVENGASHSPGASAAFIGPNGIYRADPAPRSLSAIAQSNNAVREAAIPRQDEDNLRVAPTSIFGTPLPKVKLGVGPNRNRDQ